MDKLAERTFANNTQFCAAPGNIVAWKHYRQDPNDRNRVLVENKTLMSVWFRSLTSNALAVRSYGKARQVYLSRLLKNTGLDAVSRT